MRIVSWNANCNWNALAAKSGTNKLNYLKETTCFDVAFLMEYPRDLSLKGLAGVVEAQGADIDGAPLDIPFCYPRKQRGHDTRCVGLWLAKDSEVMVEKAVVFFPQSEHQYAFACGYVLKEKGKEYHLVGLWNFPFCPALHGNYLDNCKYMLNSPEIQDFLAFENAILVGDFNITAFHSDGKHEQEREALAAWIQKLNLKWIYGTDGTGNPLPTFFQHKEKSKGQAIDFCAVSGAIASRCKLTYGAFSVFVEIKNGKASHSDHIPLILETL